MTNTFNTGNPIGSNSLKDVSDNASNFDEFNLSPKPSFVDRLGDRRSTLAGLEAMVNNFLLANGYQDLGAYAAGVVLTTINQVVDYQGQLYRTAGNTPRPFTLSGNFGTDLPNLILVPGGDGQLRSNLAATNGASLVGAPGDSRTLLDRILDQTALTDFVGVAKDGSASVNVALTNANSASLSGLTIPAGKFLVSASITLSMPIGMAAGSVFIIPDGVTLTFGDSFDATRGFHFDCRGTGKVVFNQRVVNIGYAEWWGATTQLMTDATAAIQSSHIACPRTQLGAADYFIAGQLTLITPGHVLEGMGCDWYNKVGDSTRIVSMSGTSHGIVIGGLTQPASINDFPQGIVVKNILHTRSVAPVIASACVGFLAHFALFGKFENCKSAESMHGFQYNADVQVETIRCQGFRSIGGTGSGTDYYRAFYQEGTTVLPGVAGGNASMHWDRCVGGCVLTGILAYGVYLNGAWADTFISNFEMSNCSVGIYCQGDTSATQNFKDLDLHLINPIIDQFRFAGIFIDGGGPFGTISINGGYAAPAGASPTACIYVLSCQSAVNIDGGFQYVGAGNAGMTASLLIYGSNNVTSIGNVHIDCAAAVVQLVGANSCTIKDRVMNNANNSPAGCQLTSSNNNVIELTLSGKNGAFVYGVDLLGSANNLNEIRTSGMASSAISSGTKVRVNGAPVTAAGAVGTNLVQGILA